MRTLVTAIAAVVVAALALTSSSSSETQGVARFRETQISHALTGDAAASVEVWRTRVWLVTRQQAVGTGAIACVRVDNNTSTRECHGTYILPRGRIQVVGEILNRAAFQLSIVGGTGIYVAGGGVAVFAGLKNPALITFFLN